MITAIPGAMAIFFTCLHVTFWRRDNRSSGEPPFNHVQIRDKVYMWGRIYGVGAVILLQSLVEMLLKTEFTWWMRACLLGVALAATGPATRIAFDILRGYAAEKGRKKRGWRRVYDYITVEHPKPGQDTDTLLYRDDDPTQRNTDDDG
jgi:hypothetical protein